VQAAILHEFFIRIIPSAGHVADTFTNHDIFNSGVRLVKDSEIKVSSSLFPNPTVIILITIIFATGYCSIESFRGS